jgi:hypothetical protein
VDGVGSVITRNVVRLGAVASIVIAAAIVVPVAAGHDRHLGQRLLPV